MATRAKALKKFAKNVLHHDLTGMSETAVLKDLLKQEFNIDAVGNSVVSVLMNAVSSDGGETPSALVVTPKTPIDSVEIVHQPGGHCTVPAGWYTIESVTLYGEPVDLDTFYANLTERYEYSGETVNCDEHGCSLVVDCDATSVTYKHIFTYEGESCILTITQNITATDG